MRDLVEVHVLLEEEAFVAPDLEAELDKFSGYLGMVRDGAEAGEALEEVIDGVDGIWVIVVLTLDISWCDLWDVFESHDLGIRLCVDEHLFTIHFGFLLLANVDLLYDPPDLPFIFRWIFPIGVKATKKWCTIVLYSAHFDYITQ